MNKRGFSPRKKQSGRSDEDSRTGRSRKIVEKKAGVTGRKPAEGRRRFEKSDETTETPERGRNSRTGKNVARPMSKGNRSFKDAEENRRPSKSSSGPRIGKSSAVGRKNDVGTKRFSKKETKPAKDTTENKKSEGIRLNKFVANAGVCSRRDADSLIKNGEIAVNGKVVTELGTVILKTDLVRHNGVRLNAEKKIYLLLNKPKDVVTTLNDPHAKKTVLDLIGGACEERIYPVGRLDRNTTGVLLFTNDGDLAKKLTHPKHLTKKIYHVFLDKAVTADHIRQIAEGIKLEDGLIHADAISYVDKDDKTQVGIEIHSGKNRIVRRIFEHFEYDVKKLDRVFFAGLTKKGISRGKWRFLLPKEVSMLKSGFWE